MSETDALERLAELAGIAPGYWDIFGKRHDCPRQTKSRLLEAMGFDVSSDSALADSLTAFQDAPWSERIAPVAVLRLDGSPLAVSLHVAASEMGRPLRWEVRREDGLVLGDVVVPRDLPVSGGRVLADGAQRMRLRFGLPPALPMGYHRLRIGEGDDAAECLLIVAPPRAYVPSWGDGEGRVWGLNCHLYAVHRDGDWGIGDFTALAGLGGVADRLGASSVGVNPLHALFPTRPEHASPYSPSSRLFLNPLYIDIEAVPDFAASDEAQAIAGQRTFRDRLEGARRADHVDYTEVAALKRAVLEPMFDAFEAAHPPAAVDDPRRADFDAFCAAWGSVLDRFALFEAINERHAPKAPHQWPKSLRRPDTPQAKAFARRNAHRVRFFKYLQWLADRQLGRASAVCAAAGSGLGLYRDLAVGADPDGADAWADPDVLALGARFGAPPDAFNPLGQDWGIPPLHPWRLRQRAYQPFIALVRANMRHAGALRIDHVMGLMHLYWILPGAGAGEGAYVHYPFDDLLGIIALESERNRCMVVGEDLGTVPEGFRKRMEDEGVLSYRLLSFQRYDNGLFHRPDRYPHLALATATTHDLPTIIGHWQGRDVQLRRRLGLFASEADMAADEAQRARDRELLVAALKDQGMLADDFPPVRNLGPDSMEALTIAVHRFLARSPSLLLMANVDDIAAETDQLNLPGTVAEYPNWRRRLSLSIDELAASPLVRAVAAAIAQERESPDCKSSGGSRDSRV